MQGEVWRRLLRFKSFCDRTGYSLDLSKAREAGLFAKVCLYLIVVNRASGRSSTR